MKDSMTLDELILELKELRFAIACEMAVDEDTAGSVEVFMAYQPNYPMQSSIESVTALRTVNQVSKLPDVTVYLGSGGSNNYAPAKAWEGGYVDEEDDDED